MELVMEKWRAKPNNEGLETTDDWSVTGDKWPKTGAGRRGREFRKEWEGRWEGRPVIAEMEIGRHFEDNHVGMNFEAIPDMLDGCPLSHSDNKSQNSSMSVDESS